MFSQNIFQFSNFEKTVVGKPQAVKNINKHTDEQAIIVKCKYLQILAKDNKSFFL